jgi:hypothetical protein
MILWFNINNVLSRRLSRGLIQRDQTIHYLKHFMARRKESIYWNSLYNCWLCLSRIVRNICFYSQKIWQKVLINNCLSYDM